MLKYLIGIERMVDYVPIVSLPAEPNGDRGRREGADHDGEMPTEITGAAQRCGLHARNVAAGSRYSGVCGECLTGYVKS
jgi:hypothetical protein